MALLTLVFVMCNAWDSGRYKGFEYWLVKLFHTDKWEVWTCIIEHQCQAVGMESDEKKKKKKESDFSQSRCVVTIQQAGQSSPVDSYSPIQILLRLYFSLRIELTEVRSSFYVYTVQKHSVISTLFTTLFKHHSQMINDNSAGTCIGLKPGQQRLQEQTQTHSHYSSSTARESAGERKGDAERYLVRRTG